MNTISNDPKSSVLSATQAYALNQTHQAQAAFKQENPEKPSDKKNVASSLGTDTVEITVAVSKNSLDTLQRVGNLTDFLNNTALNLRQTDEGLKATSNVMEQMRATLEKIIKNFPPFPIESLDRKNILMSYASLRKEIENMTVPTPPPPMYEKVRYLWQDIFQSSDRISTPEIPENATDSYLKSASQKLEATATQVGILRSELESF